MNVRAEDGWIRFPKRFSETYGRRYELVDRGDRPLLIPIDDDPLEALREEFTEVDESVEELRERTRDDAVETAGR